MNSPTDATGRAPAAERRWRSRSLGLLAILLPLTLAVVAHESIARWWHGRDLIAREVPTGGAADFGGARWQLDALRMAPLPAGGRIPENAMGVVADFTVQVRDPDLRRNWMGCAVSLEDGAGRRWAATQVLPLPRSDARECLLAIDSGAAPGDTLRVRHAFLVPREAAPALRATLTLAPEQPYYLRFEQPPRLVQ